MEQVLKIATSVSTPLALAGLIATILFLILKQLIAKGIIRIKEQHSYNIITLIVERLFVLSLVALCLGFAGYVVAQYRKPSAEAPPTSTNGPASMPVTATVAQPAPKPDDSLHIMDAEWNEARINIDWIFGDQAAAGDYAAARRSGQSGYDAVLWAQRGSNQGGARRSIVNFGKDRTEAYLKKRHWL